MIQHPQSRHRSSFIFIFAVVAVAALLFVARFVPNAKLKEGDKPQSVPQTITPAGKLVLDVNTQQPAIGALPVDFVRSPDHTGPDGMGRYLVVVNSGFGIQFSLSTNRAQQSMALIDLKAPGAPAVIQNIYFPEPQSVNIGVCFSPLADAAGAYTLYASGGFENKIWMFTFKPGAVTPITPVSPGSNTTVKAPFIDISGFATEAPTKRYNDGAAAVYPAGLGISADGNTLFVANNLDDSVGIIHDLHGARKLERVGLNGKDYQGKEKNAGHFIYPYGVVTTAGRTGTTAFVSCWNDDSVAVIETEGGKNTVSYIAVGEHPTAMLSDPVRGRLFVVNSNSDSVSMIDTKTKREIERIDIRLAEHTKLGGTPEGLALSYDGKTLYIANAHSNSVAVVALQSISSEKPDKDDDHETEPEIPRPQQRSHVVGFIPTGLYPSALAIVNKMLFVGNGKGTGFQNSSLVSNDSGRSPNSPNDRFPAGNGGRGAGRGGEYIVALMSGNISRVTVPDDQTLARYTQQVMQDNGMLDQARNKLFRGPSPIKHVIYIIKENRTYDQVYGDIEKSGNGRDVDGDKTLAIFGDGEAARVHDGSNQSITPNQHALAMRFGVLDRFFVNAEASADGHNWSTAAISSDYTDKAFRWNYSNRGRGYDFEGFNRTRDYEFIRGTPALFPGPVSANDIANYLRQFIPYQNGSRDVAEPETKYLWDAAARTGLTYRNYGEFVSTISDADVAAVNANKRKPYPDISRTVSATPTKKALEDHYSAMSRNFDLKTPDSITTESYRAAKESSGRVDPLISKMNADERFRGESRFSEWLEEFQKYSDDFKAGKADQLPNLSIVRFSNDHTNGLAAGMPTPQFYVADNDYAVGRLVESVSNSPYWASTAIFVVEDDAQDGPDHVDAHRSGVLVISAYNREGALVHTIHNTVSLIRTMELLLGIQPMNALDASAPPIDIFHDEADLRPFKAMLPDVALDNLMSPPARDAVTQYWMKQTEKQDFVHADMADSGIINNAIWFSVRGGTSPPPNPARLPVYDVMRSGEADDDDKD